MRQGMLTYRQWVNDTDKAIDKFKIEMQRLQERWDEIEKRERERVGGREGETAKKKRREEIHGHACIPA